jgi:hypothetical protein
VSCQQVFLFIGALAFANDIVLLAPTPSAMRVMFERCDLYTNSIAFFSTLKSLKLLFIHPSGQTGYLIFPSQHFPSLGASSNMWTSGRALDIFLVVIVMIRQTF